MEQEPVHCVLFEPPGEEAETKRRELRDARKRSFRDLFRTLDDIPNNQERFDAVMWLAEDLARIDLDTAHDMYKKCGDRLLENRVLLENINGSRLRTLVDDLSK